MIFLFSLYIHHGALFALWETHQAKENIFYEQEIHVFHEVQGVERALIQQVVLKYRYRSTL